MLRIGFAEGVPQHDRARGGFGEPFDGASQGRRTVQLRHPPSADPRLMRDAGAALAVALRSERSAVLEVGDLLPADAVALAAGAVLRGFRHEIRRTPEAEPWRLRRLVLHVADRAAAEAAWREAEPGIEGALFAMQLVAEPPNLLSPEILAERLAGIPGIEADVLRPARLREEGFGALLGVARGSANRPRVVVLRRPGAFKAKPLVLVGKGVTFDTGGISIKPADGMHEMKADMAGAAAIAGAMLALSRRRSAAPVVAVLGLVENAISGRAERPGDVVRAADGSTIEIIDTDAEGRLVLADCLAWARRMFDPVAMIDLATLTGSIVTALGSQRAGLFASDAALAAAIAAAGESVAERVWPMPLSDGYAQALESDIADIRHCSPERRQPDACHAAAFLHRFAGDTPWAHLDIAGMEWRSEADDPWPEGATGYGARLLDRLVAARFEDPDHWPDAGH
jgi:leucyl aminopeptidase